MARATPRMLLVGFLFAALLVGGASLAWACTKQAHIAELIPNSGPAGTTVQVKGGHFTENQPIELQLQNSSGDPVTDLAATTGESLSAAVTIPANAESGVYVVLATAYDEDGNVTGQAASPFEVVSASGQTASAPAAGGEPAQAPSARTGSGDLWSGFGAGEPTAGTNRPEAISQPDAGFPLALALGVLGLGGVLLAAGGLVAMRPRLAPARTRPGRSD